MNIFETVRAIRTILDPPTRRTLLLATIVATLIAFVDTFAIALILPLVTLATGSQDDSDVGRIVSNLLGDPEPATLVLVLTIVVVTLFIFKDLATVAFTWWITGFKLLKRVDLSTRLLRRFLTMPYTEVSRRSSAELMRTMNDAVAQFFGTIIYALMTLVSSVATLIAIAVALLISAPLPSVALGIYFGLAASAYLHIMKPRSRRAGKEAAEAASDAYRTAFAALGGIKTTKLRGSQEYFVQEYRSASLRGANAARISEFISAAPRYLLEILFILAVGVVLVANTAWSSGDAGFGFGVMALFVAAGLRALPAVTSVIGQIGSLRFGAGFLDLILAEVRGEEADEIRLASASHAEHDAIIFNDRIALEGVSFQYPDGEGWAVRGVTLDIPHGTSLAIVGGSGAGKTTLLDLILGLHRPTEGHIFVDGRDVEQNLPVWQRSVGYVPQEVFLQEATLAENVAFDQRAEQIDAIRLANAIRRAQLDDVVSGLELGLKSPIGERGSRLSGGQRQRIGIARAIYQEPKLLVLDEATSALDNETENRVSEAIRQLHGSLTMVIVAHRLSTVRHVDTVVLLHEGRIEAIGSFDQLRLSSPRFARMVKLGSLN